MENVGLVVGRAVLIVKLSPFKNEVVYYPQLEEVFRKCKKPGSNF